MESVEMLQPRATSSDEYSSFYYDHNPLSIPIIETPSVDQVLHWATKGSHSKHKKTKKPPVVSFELPPSCQAADPSLERSQYGSVLIIGRSGTGKSSLLKQLVQRLPQDRSLYLVNVKSDEKETYERLHAGGSAKVTSLSLDSLGKIASRSMVIVEDIITMKEKEQAKLREAVNYTAHHKKCKLFCVTHTVFKTGIFSLMPLFHYIVFTSSPANGPVIKQTFAQFGISKTESENLVLQMEDKTRELQRSLNAQTDARSIMYFFDCTQMNVGYTSDSFRRERTFMLQPHEKTLDEKESLSALATTKPRSELFEAFFPNNGAARAILQFILASKLASAHLDISNLTFAFPSRSPKKPSKRVSLVDYLTTALSASKKPAADVRLLHIFLSSRCHLPRSVIVNSKLQSLIDIQHGIKQKKEENEQQRVSVLRRGEQQQHEHQRRQSRRMLS